MCLRLTFTLPPAWHLPAHPLRARFPDWLKTTSSGTVVIGFNQFQLRYWWFVLMKGLPGVDRTTRMLTAWEDTCEFMEFFSFILSRREYASACRFHYRVHTAWVRSLVCQPRPIQSSYRPNLDPVVPSILTRPAEISLDTKYRPCENSTPVHVDGLIGITSLDLPDDRPPLPWAVVH